MSKAPYSEAAAKLLQQIESAPGFVEMLGSLPFDPERSLAEHLDEDPFLLHEDILQARFMGHVGLDVGHYSADMSERGRFVVYVYAGPDEFGIISEREARTVPDLFACIQQALRDVVALSAERSRR